MTIRNVTRTPLELKLIERYRSPKSGETDLSAVSITKTFTGLWANTGKLHTTVLAQKSRAFVSEKKCVFIGPHQVSRTDIRSPDKSLREILRLTFDIDGEQYRVDVVPCRSNQFTTLASLSRDPCYNITAIYLSESSFLALFSSAHLQSWMQDLRDETLLSALSIPGTHNSATCHRALPSVRCQAVSPRLQLENGVRFFDIRVQVETPEDPKKDSLILVHSIFPISLTGTKYFREVVNDVLAFLSRNSSETVILCIKREGMGKGTDAHLCQILRDHYAGDFTIWFTEPRIPSLGEARHKIVLIRRFGLTGELKAACEGRGWCIDAAQWPDNTPNDMCASGDICIQDFYGVLSTKNIEKKLTYSKDHLERAAQRISVLPGTRFQVANENAKCPFYINFLSASNFWTVGCWPEKIAGKLTPAVVDYICREHHAGNLAADSAQERQGDGSTGIVVSDWVGNGGDWSLVRCIIGMNAKLMCEKNGPPLTNGLQ